MRGIPVASLVITSAFVAAIHWASMLCVPALGQESTQAAAARPLIMQRVDESNLTALKGNTHPLARPEFDLGTAPATHPMDRMLLVLKRSAEQEAALRQLLDDQQNKASANYHKWLTPEQFGQQFGPTDGDMQTITAWLQSHGFQVGTTNGRTVVEFSGSASQVQEAFHTTIHKYIVNGEQHWANATDPLIPTALLPAVAGVASLNNFPRRPMNRFVGRFSRDKATGKVRPVSPLFTYQPSYQCSADNYCFALGPYDFATIYKVLPLWNDHINGTGQTIAIVAESNINPQDVANFRGLFDLPANSTANGNPLNVILNGPDPGLQPDESEADIDVQWSGAIAPYATIDFVVSRSTETTSGTDLSAVYIVDNNLAAVMSESYGLCELGLGTSGNQFYNALWQQAAAQGITVFISAGDNGAAGCDDFNAKSPAPAQYGLAVSGYASTPYNVAVGGTDFYEFTDPEQYWSITNNSTTQASALGYIPETTWNDSCTNAIWETVSGLSQSPETNCNNPQLNDVVTEGGSGGPSDCTTPTGSTPASCTGGYAKPSWQTGSGVPNDEKRDLPDVSLFASNGFAGSFYIICQSDQTDGSCSSSSPDQNFLGFGGTSVSSPAFAGIMALVNQQTGSRQGNANYVLYKLAAKDTLASCNASSGPASTCIFNDVTSGTNAMPCATGSPNCTTSISGDLYGILNGYNAGTGYDRATGLGSVNANNLVMQWGSVTFLPSTTTLNSLTPTTITHGQPVNFSVTVKPESGTGTPTGEISLLGGPNGSSPASAGFNLAGGTASGTTELLPGGTYSVTARYAGDGTYASSASNPISVTVNKENSQPQVFLVTYNSNGNIVSSDTNTAVYGSTYVLRVNVENSLGALCTPVSATAATGCPSGTVAMTDNGATLDAGTYTLNSYGFFEDFTVQLPGGTDSVKAAYAGDNSFNASMTTSTITITPAGSSMNAPSVYTYGVGNAFSASAVVQSLSSGVPPTGTVTFLTNGTPLTGTTTYQPGTQTGPPPVAFVTANFTSSASAFPKPGSYSITASYGGDGNYAPVISSATQVTVLYPAPFSSVNPFSQDVNPGSTATLTALIDSQHKTVYPTGTITLTNSQTGAIVVGPTACTSTKDSSGNYACQASVSFTVSTTIFLNVLYSGDANYPGTNTLAEIFANDFNIGVNSTTIYNVVQGQSLGVQIDIGDSGTFNGTVGNFTCSGLPPGTTYSFNPTQVPGSGSTMLTIATTPVGQAQRRASNQSRGIWWMASAILPLLGICLIGIPSLRRRGALHVLVVVLFLTLPSCGGGGSGGGGGGGGQQVTNNPVPSITSISPTQQAAGSVSQALTITGSGFVFDSNVTYNNVRHATSYVSATQLTILLTAKDLATTGSYPVVVTNPAPGGGVSSAVDFNVVTGTPTGTFTVTVTGSSGSLTHSTNFTLTVNP
jgi:Pro-kumamolisin, activation domain/Bacterial Ig-like domain (group 3)